MDGIEMLKKVAELITLAGGMVALLWRLADRRRESSLRLTKSEIELITHPLGFPKDDPTYVKFVEDFAKERRTQVMFRRSIPNGKLGPLMEFYDLGQATTKEISAAWAHH